MPLSFDPIAEARRNWEAHGWGAAVQMSAATSITRAHQILLQRIDAALEPHGLVFSRFEALALLSFSRTGSLPLGKIQGIKNDVFLKLATFVLMNLVWESEL